jgi:hypothetical protein
MDFDWSPFSSACFSWHWKNWEKYEGALAFLAWVRKVRHRGWEYLPSELILAPLNLNSSLPICIGKTLSWGSISGISVFIFLADKIRGSRRIPGGSGLTFFWVSSVGMVIPLAAGFFT